MNDINKIAKELAEIIKSSDEKKTSAYDTPAEVTRIEGSTAWVHIPGGVDETPVKLTVNAKVGDTVQVRVSGGRAWITGNATAPPTDDGVANIAMDNAQVAYNLAGEAQEAADTAYDAAERAVDSANVAKEAAEQAETHASDALASAVEANRYAVGALNGLSDVEKVIDVLNWVAQHGEYNLTEDEEVLEGKTYFQRTGSGTDEDPYVYTPISNPSGGPAEEGYYELSGVDEGITNFISTHLALLDDGLYITLNNAAYRVKITNTAVHIINDVGTIIATYSATTVIGDPELNNILIDSDSVDVRKGEKTVASFGEETRIGEEGESGVMIISSAGMQGINSDNVEVFNVAMDGGSITVTDEIEIPNTKNKSAVTVKCKAGGNVYLNGVRFQIINSDYMFRSIKTQSGCTVSISSSTSKRMQVNWDDGVFISPNSTTANASAVINIYHSDRQISEELRIDLTATYANEQVTIRMNLSGYSADIGDTYIDGQLYGTLLTNAPSFTVGTRTNDDEAGIFSVALGEGLYASNPHQISLGAYNTDNAVMLSIGNGSDDDNRYDILTLDDYGDLAIEGELSIGGGITLKNIVGGTNASSYIDLWDGGQYGNEIGIQAGGNLIIGSGEFPRNFHDSPEDVLIPSGASIPYGTTNEKTYIGSDAQVYIITNGNTVADSKVWQFQTSGATEFPYHIYMQHATILYGRDSGNNWQLVLEPWNSNGNTTLGYAHYSTEEGNTDIYGYGINLFSKAGVLIRDNLVGVSVQSGTKTWTFETDGYLTSPNSTSLGVGDGTTDTINMWGNTTNKVALSVTNSDDNERYAIQAKSDRIRLYNYTTSSTVYDLFPVKGTSPVSVSSGTISVANVTTSANGLMLATDKVKLNKISLGSGLTTANFGDGTSTDQTWIYGNSTNKVAVGAYNNTDKKRYMLYATASALRVYNYTDSSYLYDIYPVSGSSPVSVSNGVVSVSDATTSARGLMTSADKTKLNKFTLAGGITTVYLGDGTNTTQVNVWGNSTNKVAVSATNAQENKRYNLLARSGYLRLDNNTDGTTVWDIYPASFQSGDTYTVPVGPYAGYVTSSSTQMVFFVPLPRSCSGMTVAQSAKVAMTVRGTQGYVDDSYNTTTVGSSSAYTWACANGTNGVRVTITKSSALTNVTNNTPIEVHLRANLTFKFT